jgi:hypothetical protein
MSISVSLTALKSLAAALRMLDVQHVEHVAIVYWHFMLYQQHYYNVSLHVVCYYNRSAY